MKIEELRETEPLLDAYELKEGKYYMIIVPLSARVEQLMEPLTEIAKVLKLKGGCVLTMDDPREFRIFELDNQPKEDVETPQRPEEVT